MKPTSGQTILVAWLILGSIIMIAAAPSLFLIVQMVGFPWQHAGFVIDFVMFLFGLFCVVSSLLVVQRVKIGPLLLCVSAWAVVIYGIYFLVFGGIEETETSYTLTVFFGLSLACMTLWYRQTLAHS